MKLKDAVDVIFSHNEVLELWVPDKEDPHYSNLICRCMAHAIPEEYVDSENWKIFGTAKENPWNNDSINIRLYDV